MTQRSLGNDVATLKDEVKKLEEDMSIVRERTAQMDAKLTDHIHTCLRQFDVIHNEVKDHAQRQTIGFEQVKQLAGMVHTNQESIKTNYEALHNSKVFQARANVYFGIMAAVGVGSIGFVGNIIWKIVEKTL